MIFNFNVYISQYITSLISNNSHHFMFLEQIFLEGIKASLFTGPSGWHMQFFTNSTINTSC